MTSPALPQLVSEVLDADAVRIAVLDASGAAVSINKAWSRFARTNAGLPGAECRIGTNYLTAVQAALRRGGPANRLGCSAIEEVLRGERDECSLQYRCETAGGERWFRIAVTRIESGPARYLLVAHDEITAQESERLLRAVLDALPVGVWILGPDGRIAHGNPAGVRIWGGARFVGPQEFGTYKGWWLSTGEPIAAEDWAAARAIRKGEMAIDEEIEIEGFDGTRRIILNSAIPLHDHEHRIAGAIIVNQDISARKRAEAEREVLLRQQEGLRAAAEEATRLKDEFIATLSHELRTPLNAVLGWVAVLKTARADREVLERAVGAIERNAGILAQLLDDTLDVSRIIRGEFALEESVVDLAAVIREVVEGMRPAAIQNEIALVESGCGGDATVRGDPIRLQQVVWNLLANALKYTQRGGRIDVRIDVAEEDVEVSVQDTGVGIVSEFMPFIFDRYRQSERSPAPGQRSLGLGLAIVKDLVERHGGTVTAESPGRDRGATFRFRLPRAPRSRMPEQD